MPRDLLTFTKVFIWLRFLSDILRYTTIPAPGPHMGNYISYLRVSTTRQGESGLGLEAQRDSVAGYVAASGGVLVREYLEVESGKLRDRPILHEALGHCRREKAVLVIAKLDRLARNVAFVSSLMEAKTEFVAVDAPFANRLMVHIMAAFAEHERDQIAMRTRAALAAAKARGVKLGVNGARLAIQRKAEAAIHAESLRSQVGRLTEPGLTLQAVADRLNEAGIPTREGACWAPTTVRRLLIRLDLHPGHSGGARAATASPADVPVAWVTNIPESAHAACTPPPSPPWTTC
jgi:DNA invertase Pin-like site-specific DNA recombinase